MMSKNIDSGKHNLFYSNLTNIIIIISLFCVERFYDHLNLVEQYKHEFITNSHKIVHKCQFRDSLICDSDLKNDLINYLSDAVTYRKYIGLDRKSSISHFNTMTNKIELTIKHDLCLCEEIIDEIKILCNQI